MTGRFSCAQFVDVSWGGREPETAYPGFFMDV
jgi:hypothetical protein